MRICDACHVHVRGSMDRCPLCGTKLRGEKEENVFPRLQMYDHMYRKIMRIFLFLSVIAVIVCLAANRVFVPDLFWSMFVLAGVVSFWISLYAAWKKKRNIPKGILWEMTVISILAVAWDMGTGWHGWSLSCLSSVPCPLG
nr:DUF6320 domain-containing protein [uncultured Anaerotignum sp.]